MNALEYLTRKYSVSSTFIDAARAGTLLNVIGGRANARKLVAAAVLKGDDHDLQQLSIMLRLLSTRDQPSTRVKARAIAHGMMFADKVPIIE